jgi:hypothetical protein
VMASVSPNLQRQLALERAHRQRLKEGARQIQTKQKQFLGKLNQESERKSDG